MFIHQPTSQIRINRKTRSLVAEIGKIWLWPPPNVAMMAFITTKARPELIIGPI